MSMAMMVIGAHWVYLLIALVIVFAFLGIGVIMMIHSKVPEAWILLRAASFNRPLVQLHTNIGQTKLYAPRPEGEKHHDGNMYEIPKVGIKFIPDPTIVEHMGIKRHIHYYSKAGTAIMAKVAAACRDFNYVLDKRGIEPTEMLIDSLLVADDTELLERYPPELISDEEEIVEGDLSIIELNGERVRLSESYNTIKDIRAELQNMVIRDGQFVFQTVHDFIFAVQAETARGLDEYCGIANERAVEAAGLLKTKDYSMIVFLFVFLIIGAVIAYKMLTG